MVGMALEATGCSAAVGSRCLIALSEANQVEAEIVGFSDERLYMMPVDQLHGIEPGARVLPSRQAFTVGVGPELLGRVLDGAGQPLDGGSPIRIDERVRLQAQPMNPLRRVPITKPLDVGVRALNGLFCLGRGQRLGLFASSGVGKSMLMGMMTRFTEADVIVVGLIGERGREVQEFVSQNLDNATRRKAVIVATPADHSPLMRAHGALLATSIAEHFRDRGKQVLLLMDSLTRYAQAHREIALAIGEMPATKGYPASVFARLPQLVERAGTGGANGGTITAIYTVLTEVDDANDPIADAARAVLDGHIVLSRSFAEAGIYPAIDVQRSVSRLTQTVAAAPQLELIRRFRALHADYEAHRDLITIGAYAAGSDPRVDEAIKYWPRMVEYLRQAAGQRVALGPSLSDLQSLFAEPPAKPV
jgi:flagellum-specific ATP synthase